MTSESMAVRSSFGPTLHTTLSTDSRQGFPTTTVFEAPLENLGGPGILSVELPSYTDMGGRLPPSQRSSVRQSRQRLHDGCHR